MSNVSQTQFLVLTFVFRGLAAGAENGERGYMLTFAIAYLRVSIFSLRIISTEVYRGLSVKKYVPLHEISVLIT